MADHARFVGVVLVAVLATEVAVGVATLYSRAHGIHRANAGVHSNTAVLGAQAVSTPSSATSQPAASEDRTDTYFEESPETSAVVSMGETYPRLTSERERAIKAREAIISSKEYAECQSAAEHLQIQTWFGPFLASLPITSSQRSAALQILIDKKLLPTDINAALATSVQPPSLLAYYDIAKNSYADASARLDARLRGILGNKASRQLTQYSAEIGKHLVPAEVNQLLAGQGAPLMSNEDLGRLAKYIDADGTAADNKMSLLAAEVDEPGQYQVHGLRCLGLKSGDACITAEGQIMSVVGVSPATIAKVQSEMGDAAANALRVIAAQHQASIALARLAHLR